MIVGRHEGQPEDTSGETGAPTLADELAALDRHARVLAVGAGPAELPDDRQIDRLPADAGIPDLEGAGVYDLVVVLGLSAAAPEPLLGRLRDLHARRILITGDAAARFAPRDMLALGFENHAGRAGAQRSYLYDRDAYNRAREWNSPENWANPDNFDKYRW